MALRQCRRCPEQYKAGHYGVHRLDHPGRSRPPLPHLSDRNLAIVEAVRSRESAASVGRRLGLTRERVRQIYTRITGEALPRWGVRCRICDESYISSFDGRRERAHRASDNHRAARRRRSEDRFWTKVDRSKPYGCWPWLGLTFPTGYGHTTILGEQYAHRLAYKLVVGPIPRGLTIDHLCRNRICANPAHLEPVTYRENVLRSPIAPAAINARKTHCRQGHAYSGENLLLRNHGRARICRACRNARSRQQTAEKTAARRMAREAA